MNCSKYKDQLHSFAKSTLKPSEQQVLATHLKSCPQCSQAISDIRRTEEFLKANRLVLPPPPEIKLNIMAAIDLNKYKVPQKKKNRFDLNNWGLSMVAAGLILIILNLAPGLNHLTATENQFYSSLNNLSHSVGTAFDTIEKLDGITMRIEKESKGGM